jgi:hypothetical protein
MLSMLLPGTTDKQCYLRGKKLGLKKVSADEARQKSRKLLSEQQTQHTDKKVAFALQKFILAKLDQQPDLTKKGVVSYLDYIKAISDEYVAYRKQEDDMVLFGGELELQDIKRVATKSGAKEAKHMLTPFVVVPLTRNDF